MNNKRNIILPDWMLRQSDESKEDYIKDEIERLDAKEKWKIDYGYYIDYPSLHDHKYDYDFIYKDWKWKWWFVDKMDNDYGSYTEEEFNEEFPWLKQEYMTVRWEEDKILEKYDKEKKTLFFIYDNIPMIVDYWIHCSFKFIKWEWLRYILESYEREDINEVKQEEFEKQIPWIYDEYLKMKETLELPEFMTELNNLSK